MNLRAICASMLLLGAIGTGLSAYAADLAASFVAARPAPPSGTLPIVIIKSPAPGTVYKTVRVNGQSGPTLECLMEVKDREVVLDVKNWNVAPSGPGVAIIVDGRYGAVVHDVSKPIRLDSIVPFESDPKVISECNWHMIAAFATQADGSSVKSPGALAVTTFFNGHTGADVDLSRKPADNGTSVIVNLPLLGTYHSFPATRTGGYWVPKSSARVPIDYVLFNTSAQAAQCTLRHDYQYLNQGSQRPLRDEGLGASLGLTYLQNLPTEADMSVSIELRCPGDSFGLWGDASFTLSAKEIPASPNDSKLAAAWPSKGAPPPKPASPRTSWDDSYWLQSGGGCAGGGPTEFKVVKNVMIMPVTFGAFGFGEQRLKLERDGTINPQTVRLSPGKRLPKQDPSDDVIKAANRMAQMSIEAKFIETDDHQVFADIKVAALDDKGDDVATRAAGYSCDYRYASSHTKIKAGFGGGDGKSGHERNQECRKRRSGMICGTNRDCCSKKCIPDPKRNVSKLCM